MFELFQFEDALNWQNRKHLIWEGFCSAALKILHTYRKSAHSLQDQLAWQTLDILYTILNIYIYICVFPYKNFLQAKAWHARVCPGAIKKELFLSKFRACKSCCIDNTWYQRVHFNPTSCSQANVSLASALYLAAGWTTSERGGRGSSALQAHSSRKLTFNLKKILIQISEEPEWPPAF